MVKDLDGTAVYSPFGEITPSKHLSMVFNIFVLLQIFNMLAARKIHDEINFLSGVHTNPMFIGVWIVICVAHFGIIQFGSRAMKVHINGLSVD